MKAMKSLLVFDLDGTLIDSAPDIVRAVNLTLEHYGKPPQSFDVVVSHIGEGLRNLISGMFAGDALNEKDIDAIQSHFLKTYEEEMTRETSIFPGVEDFLNSYPGPIAIITNKNESPAKKIIEHLGLDRFPWLHIFGADSLAERKPSPLPLRTVMATAGYKPENTFMIGDGIPDMISAQRAGVASIAIHFGYTDIKILNKYEPHGVLHHYSELHTLLTRLR